MSTRPGAAAAASTPDSPAHRLARLKSGPRRSGQASFFYLDTLFNAPAVKVLPGEFFVSQTDLVMTTTLGSCIAACLWDRERRIGGMNHFLLPDSGRAGGPATGLLADSGRYGGFAMDQLIGEMVKRGATRGNMEAKVFGGGAVVSGMSSIKVGDLNTRFVLDYLRTERIAVVSQDVLGINARKVCFLPHTGKAMVKRLASTNKQALLEQELAAARRAAPAGTSAGSVELF
jgi:chemotaxis protein CheD